MSKDYRESNQYKKVRDYVLIGLSIAAIGVSVNHIIEKRQRHSALEEAADPATSIERRKQLCERHKDLDIKIIIPFINCFQIINNFLESSETTCQTLIK